MGVDFLEKARKPFKKHLDRQRAKLAAPDLLTIEPELKGRVLLAETVNGACLAPGDKITVAEDAGALLVCRSNVLVAKLCFPPVNILDSLSREDVIIKGTVVETNEISKTLGIRIEE